MVLRFYCDSRAVVGGKLRENDEQRPRKDKLSETTRGSNEEEWSCSVQMMNNKAKKSRPFCLKCYDLYKTFVLDMPKCLPRLRRSAGCANKISETPRGGANTFATRGRWPRLHCLVDSEIVGISNSWVVVAPSLE